MAQMEKKFQKLVAIEPVSLIPSAQEELKQYADQVILYEDIPADEEEIVRRIGDAEAVLVSYTSQIRRQVIEQCPNIRYIGMCCRRGTGAAVVPGDQDHLRPGFRHTGGHSPHACLRHQFDRDRRVGISVF